MRSIVWLGSAAAALLLLVIAAVIGLRGSSPPPRPATAAAPAPAQQATPRASAEVLPSFDIVRIDPHGHVVIAGRAAPGDAVRVLDEGKPLGEVTADQRGEWVLAPEAPLAPGNRQLSLEATGPGGSAVRGSPDVVALSVAPPGSGADSSASVAVLLPGDAAKSPKVLQQAPGAAPGQGLALESAEYGADGNLVLSGHGEPGSRINVYAADRLLGTASPDSAGHWSLTAPYRDAGRGGELRLDQLAADGNVSRRIAAPLELTGATAPAGGENYTVQRGNSLWLIARQIYGQGTRYTIIYSANRELIRDPNKIYPGQQFKMPKS